MIEGLVQSAQKVVKAVSEISPFPISLTDEQGIIIGDTNSNRIGSIHPPSEYVLEVKRPVLFDQHMIQQYENVLPGIAVPLNFGYKTVGVLGIIGDPKNVEPYALLLKNYVEMLWKEIYQSQQDSLYSHTLERFTQYVLLNNELDEGQTEQYSNDLNVAINKKRICMIVTLNHPIIYYAEQTLIPIDQMKQKITHLVKEVFHSKNDLCTFINYEKIVLWKSFLSKKHYEQFIDRFDSNAIKLQHCLKDLHIHHIHIAAGTISESLYTLHQSYQDAERLIRLAHKYQLTQSYYHYHSWEILSKLILDDISDTTWNYFEDYFYDFVKLDDFKDLAECFLSYCDHQMNVSRAAQDLYIHRNTLSYRLNKIEKMTSIHVNNFYDCSTLYIFLKYYLNKTCLQNF
ncbi:sugar diacid recognition domain-containing protein [Piscibacillus halophilus]|uniref:sugar diacid recognition domain-containing protein n=1 Tax=Piscibacillus halophilus TaxID=571933 RepID=UPI001588394A|nr:sugar diacid recognition domain-containing protein [Piscibacillus halophilus]